MGLIAKRPLRSSHSVTLHALVECPRAEASGIYPVISLNGYAVPAFSLLGLIFSHGSSRNFRLTLLAPPSAAQKVNKAMIFSGQ